MDNNIVEARELTLENFRKYGSYVKLPEVSGIMPLSLRVAKLSIFSFFWRKEPTIAILN